MDYGLHNLYTFYVKINQLISYLKHLEYFIYFYTDLVLQTYLLLSITTKFTNRYYVVKLKDINV